MSDFYSFLRRTGPPPPPRLQARHGPSALSRVCGGAEHRDVDLGSRPALHVSGGAFTPLLELWGTGTQLQDGERIGCLHLPPVPASSQEVLVLCDSVKSKKQTSHLNWGGRAYGAALTPCAWRTNQETTLHPQVEDF